VGGDEPSSVLVSIGVKEIHPNGVGELVVLKVAVEVWVRVKVRLGRILTSVLVAVGEAVGVKKSRAKASCVRARSSGVGVGENLGTGTISSWVSTLPPEITNGRPKARAHTPIKTNTIIAPCDFKLLVSPSICQSSVTAIARPRAADTSDKC
jgi:hypothetical protein